MNALRKRRIERLKARAIVQVALADQAVHESRIVLTTMRILRVRRP